MLRTLSSEDREYVIAFVGPDSWRVKEDHIHVGGGFDDAGIPRHFTMLADNGEVDMYVSEHDLPVLLHEYGHGTHALKYPDSIDWPIWKAEAFAFMSDMRALKRKGLLTPELRTDFARHIRGARRDGNADHKRGMKVAFRAVFFNTWPKAQEAYIVNAT